MSPRGFTVAEETLESLEALWRDPRAGLDWDCLFVVPAWLRAWWSAFGEGNDRILLRSVRDGATVIGVAALRAEGDMARFLGSEDVCDFQDVVARRGREREFLSGLLDGLSEEGVSRLDLGLLRPDSAVIRELPGAAEARGWRVSRDLEDTAVELDLPGAWDEYLARLNKKERHEIRRKLRRLEGAGEVSLRRVNPKLSLEGDGTAFLGLFRGYRPDKAEFLSEQREAYFRALLQNMARAELLDLWFLDVGGEPAAAVLCFRYRSTTYLYNNGYDPRFEHLSVGLVIKALTIRESIAAGQARYSFLKGAEAYKLRLGGRQVPLYRCRLIREDREP